MRRYVVIQLMMFVFGIVGPIFLVMFFVSQPDSTMKWAYWIGLFVTYADVMIALALTASGEDMQGKRLAGKRGMQHH
ncbi:putative membrane protein [Mycobacterium kansasii 732]|nr:putative membrane protein [Mycobacterium kansasii 732]